MSRDIEKQFEQLPDDDIEWFSNALKRFESYYDPEWLAQQRATQPFSISETVKKEAKKRKRKRAKGK